MIEIYPRGEGYFYIYGVAMREGGERGLYPLLFSSFLPSFFFLLLLITVHDRHAEREESNYGMVGEDISYGVGKRKKKKTYFEGVAIFFMETWPIYLSYTRVSLSVFLNEILHSIRLINISIFLFSHTFKKNFCVKDRVKLNF